MINSRWLFRLCYDENAAERQHCAVLPGGVSRVEKLLVFGDELRSKIIRQRLQNRSRPGPGDPAKYRIGPRQYVQVGGLPGIDRAAQTSKISQVRRRIG